MKKKIKDLTLEECKVICDKYDSIEQCVYKCPLRKLCGTSMLIAHIDIGQLDKEVELL